jgi:predicted lipoprotein with Yx(FWY)xxD motif
MNPTATSRHRRAGRARRLVVLAPAGVAMAFAACGGMAASKSPGPTATAVSTGSTASANATTLGRATASASTASPAPRARTTGIRISVRSSEYGRILRGPNDRTIYLFTHDRSSQSTCYGTCAAAWPPVLTKGAPAAGSGLDARLLGTTRRRGGALQVTYGGHPLYYYVGDVNPGQILCQNVEEFGGTWLVLSPRGTAVG